MTEEEIAAREAKGVKLAQWVIIIFALICLLAYFFGPDTSNKSGKGVVAHPTYTEAGPNDRCPSLDVVKTKDGYKIVCVYGGD